MAIEEVPIEGSDTQASDAPEAAPVEAAPAAPAVVARKRGRPKGVPNKPKTVQLVEEVAIEPPKEAKAKEAKAKEAKAKAKAAPKKPKKVRVVPPSDSEDEPAPPPKRRKEIPPPLDTRHIASEVLQLLSDRHVEKKHAQRQKYASWFQ
jgi:hypothetical protein